MRVLIRTIFSSLSQAWQQLTGNKLRTFLSLLGVSIGIFCIVAVQAAVASLQDNVINSLSKLGDETFYIGKYPWGGGGGDDYPWWEYMKRPDNKFAEYEALREQLGSDGDAGLFMEGASRTIKWRSNAVERAGVAAGSLEMEDFFGFEFEEGRSFTPVEYNNAANVVILGFEVAIELFGGIDPIGKKVKAMGQQLTVIGVLKKSGDDLISMIKFDEGIVVPYTFAKKVYNRKTRERSLILMAKPAPGVDQKRVKDAVTIALRKERGLRPTEKDNFAINNISVLAGALDSIFGVIRGVGFIVGVFAIFVGGFSVANIMFVSVQERTNLIGVKMALGASRPVILLEFLIESIALCFIGGLMGLAFVTLAIWGLNQVMPWEMALSPQIASLGIGLAVLIGLFAGIIPAYRASRMDPVAAIRA